MSKINRFVVSVALNAVQSLLPRPISFHCPILSDRGGQWSSKGPLGFKYSLVRENLLSEYIFEIYFSKKILLEIGGLWMFLWSGNVLVMCRGEMGLYFSSVIIFGVRFHQYISEICLLNRIFFLNQMLGCLAVGWLGGKHYWHFENQKYWAGLEIKAGGFFFGLGGCLGLC